jgi:hypothetical protein
MTAFTGACELFWMNRRGFVILFHSGMFGMTGVAPGLIFRSHMERMPVLLFMACTAIHSA